MRHTVTVLIVMLPSRGPNPHWREHTYNTPVLGTYSYKQEATVFSFRGLLHMHCGCWQKNTKMIDGHTSTASPGSSICACKTLLVMLKIQSLHALQTSATLGMSCPYGMWLNMRSQRSAFSSKAFIPTSLQQIQPLSLFPLDFQMGLLPVCK